MKIRCLNRIQEYALFTGYRRMPIILDDFYGLRTVIGVKTYGATDGLKEVAAFR
jgi:hypothetical protein